MDRGVTYSAVVQRGLQPGSAHVATRPTRVPVNRPGKPPTKVCVTKPNKPVRTEKLPPKEPDWNARGAARAKEFVAAVLDGDTEKMHAAYYDPGFGKESKKLFETINERRKTSDWRPAWVSESLV